MTILKDTSLCAIVRDEKTNTAGGIRRFVESHVPYVESAIIADTGSVDGTRQILEGLQAEYPNLKVIDIPFEGYATSRNKALMHVETRRALMLDADELITHETPKNYWNVLAEEIIKGDKLNIFHIDILNLLPNGNSWYIPSSGERLFKKGQRFRGKIWEIINPFYDKNLAGMHIYHFLPSIEALKMKEINFYGDTCGDFGRTFKRRIIEGRICPSQIEGFQEWKKYNPQRDKYI